MNDILSVSYGAGVNSVAMLCGYKERGIRPTVILHADPGAEKPETYAHMELVQAWLRSIGWPPIISVSVGDNPTAVAKTLEASCLKNETLPSIAYGFKTCSQRWKADPQRKFFNNWAEGLEVIAAGGKIIQAIGYDAGEKHRTLIPDAKTTFVFPLREWGWGREECIAAIQRAGLPVPMKSSCFFCPSSKKAEILWLRRNHPDLFERAVAIERNAAKKNTSVKGLGRDWSWESVVAADEAQLKMFSEVLEIPCGCFDGEPDDDELVQIGSEVRP